MFLGIALILTQACSNFGGLGIGSFSQSSVSPGEFNGNVHPDLQLFQVTKTSSSPEQSLDLIGDGSGKIGMLCNSNQGPCSCYFNYRDATGTLESIEVQASYTEGNLIRCSRSGLPGGVNQFAMRMKLEGAKSYSNEVVFVLNGGGSALSLSNPETFLEVNRYGCRDAVFIPYSISTGANFSAGVYDPYLSDHPKISYPLIFYATNIAETFNYFVANPEAQGEWICPSDPKKPSAFFDPAIYSVAPDSSDTYTIYSPDPGWVRPEGSFDRSTFYLARKPAGSFDVPLNAYIAPRTLSTFAGVPPLGYGARPVKRDGMSGEYCPTDTAIPEGFEWVKVWMFRASHADRKYPHSPSLAQQQIACNPMAFSDGSVFSQCDTATGSLSTISSNPDNLAARLMFQPALTCSCVDTDQARLCGSTRPEGHVLDEWFATGASCPSTFPAGDPAALGICNSSGWKPVAQDISALSIDGGVSRHDYMLTVSPPTVMLSEFSSNVPSSTALQYTPYRFRYEGECLSPDIDDGDLSSAEITRRETCIAEKAIRYNFKYHDITTNGDAPNTDPGRLPVYPLCAIRPQ